MMLAIFFVVGHDERNEKKKNGGGQEWDRYLFSKSIAIQHTKRTG
jgi:hypothetical protein